MRWLRFFFFPIFPFFVLFFLMRCDVAAEQFVFPWVAKQTGAEAYYHRGCICLQGGRSDSYDCAIENFSHAIEINPRYDEAYNLRGYAYFTGKGFYERAIEDLNRAIEINPRFAAAYCNRGTVYINKGSHDYDRAIEDFSHAIEINPRYAEAYHIRAMAYYLKKEYDKAWEDVHKAQDLGLQVRYRLLKDLRQASGRDK
ncbi:MAG: tetratricopeptide repeat protein [Candidatus Brocadiaceae bacterium]|nr:tetratricopeptide repeat protein [Candidatus Brocadiaceae bacterium]